MSPSLAALADAKRLALQMKGPGRYIHIPRLSAWEKLCLTGTEAKTTPLSISPHSMQAALMRGSGVSLESGTARSWTLLL